MSWVSIPDFTDQQIVTAETFQDMWANLYTLKDPTIASQINPGRGADAWALVTAGAWQNIDTDGTYYQVQFESTGNDILIVAGIENDHSASGARISYRLMLDGTAAGNSDGLYAHRHWANTIEARQLVYIWENVSAGEHVVTVQMLNNNTGTAFVQKQESLGLKVMEF